MQRYNICEFSSLTVKDYVNNGVIHITISNVKAQKTIFSTS